MGGAAPSPASGGAAAHVERREITELGRFNVTAVAPYGSVIRLDAPRDLTVGLTFVRPGARVDSGETLSTVKDPARRRAYEDAASDLRRARERLSSAKQKYSAYLHAALERVDTARSSLSDAKVAVAAARRAIVVYRPDNSSSQAADSSSSSAATYLSPTTVTVRRRPDPQALAAALARQTAARNELLAAQRTYADARLHVQHELAPVLRRHDEAYAAFRRAQAERKKDEVKSPMSGTVISLAPAGGAVVKGEALATVARLDDLVAVVRVSPDEAVSLSEGQRVVLQFDAGTFPAQIARIAQVGRQRKLTVRFDNQGHAVTPGMSGVLIARVAHAPSVLAVPLEAVSGGHASVLRDGAWQTVQVETGIDDGQWIAIKKGLHEGETVSLER